MATAFRFLLRPDLVIVQPAVLLARAKADCPAAFLRRAREMGSRRAVVAVSFAVRFSPETGPFAVVLFAVCHSLTRFATAGFVHAADPSDPAGSGFAVAVAAAVAAVVVDLSDLFAAADLSVVAAGPASAGSFPDLACLACSFAVALAKERVVAVPFCFLTHRSSF